MNEYWIYLVDSRQVLNTLLYEPRFLSITPDTGTIDIIATNTSYPFVIKIFEQLLKTKGKSSEKFRFCLFPIIHNHGLKRFLFLTAFNLFNIRSKISDTEALA